MKIKQLSERRVDVDETELTDIIENAGFTVTEIDYDTTYDGMQGEVIISLQEEYDIEKNQLYCDLCREIGKLEGVYDVDTNSYTAMDGTIRLLVVITLEGLVYNENEEGWR